MEVLCVSTTVLLVLIATQTTITVQLRPFLPAPAAELRIPWIASAEVLCVSTTVLILMAFTTVLILMAFIATLTTITVLLLRPFLPAPAAADLRIPWIASVEVLCVRTTVLLVFIATQTTITVQLRPFLPAPAAELRISWIASAEVLCVSTTIIIVGIAPHTTITALRTVLVEHTQIPRRRGSVRHARRQDTIAPVLFQPLHHQPQIIHALRGNIPTNLD